MGCSTNAFLIVGTPISESDLIVVTPAPDQCHHRNKTGARFCSVCGKAIVAPTRVWRTPQLAEKGWDRNYWRVIGSHIQMRLIPNGRDDYFFGIVLRETGELMEGGISGHSNAVTLQVISTARDRVRKYLGDLGLHDLASQVDVRIVGYVAC